MSIINAQRRQDSKLLSRLLRRVSTLRSVVNASLQRPIPELDPVDAYALWADSYPPEAHNPLMELEQNAMLELLPDLKNKIVLDLACGSGRYILKAREKGASLIYGLDFSPAMLSRARRISNQLVRGSMLSIPFESSSIDAVICGLAVGHVENLAPVVHEMGRVLRPGGHVIYSDTHPFGKLAGWKRRFHTIRGEVYTVKHYFHLYADHHTACRLSGLVIEEIREPLIEGDHPWAGCPAALAIRARKY